MVLQRICITTHDHDKISGANINFIKNGRYQEFNNHATLIAEGVYVDNKKHGLWKEYYDHTGTIMIEEHYKHGIQHGRFSSYHPTGQLLSEGEFKDGLREGYFKVYNEDGHNVKDLLFISDSQMDELVLNQLPK